MSNALPRLALSSPVVTRFPGSGSEWEEAAGPEDLVRVAQAADRLGYDHLSCSEHVAVPVAVARERGGTYWDPLATLAYLAAHTTRVRLVTKVLVQGYHHPLAVAKRYGTLDLLSGGRVVLGVGVGSLREEFELLGADFEGRGGARADEWLTAVRAALGRSVPRHVGAHYPFEDLLVEPHAVQDRLPLWIGGRSRVSLRRAVRLAEGWAPFALSPAAIAGMLEEAQPGPGFDVVLPTDRLDPEAEPQAALDHLAALRDAGATILAASLRADSGAHYVEQMAALAELARDVVTLAPGADG